MGYSPQGRKESDMTEPLHFTSLIIIDFTHISYLCPDPQLYKLYTMSSGSRRKDNYLCFLNHLFTLTVSESLVHKFRKC